MNTPAAISEQWWILRNLVFEASSMKEMPKIPDTLRGHAAVRLVESYFTDRQDTFLDEAARLVALSKPGVDCDFAEKHYWLVLDQS